MNFRPKLQACQEDPGGAEPLPLLQRTGDRTEFVCERRPVNVNCDYTLTPSQPTDEACPGFSQGHTAPGKRNCYMLQAVMASSWNRQPGPATARRGNPNGPDSSLLLSDELCSADACLMASVISFRREAQTNHPLSVRSTYLPSLPKGTENRLRRWRECHGWARQSLWAHPSALGYETRTSVFWPCRWAGPQSPEEGREKAGPMTS